MAGQSSSANITVTTSGGRISATMTMSGQTGDGGSADYVVSGTTLKFSNPSTPSVFLSLISAIEAGTYLGGDGFYHKKAN
jgi:hypothetical protein